MEAAGLPIQKKWIIECDHTLKGGVAGFGKLQALASRPTAILCSNDMTAIGVLRAAYMGGLRVPQDLSVIGLDDIDFAEFTLPPLTTIRLSRADLARAAFEALRQQAEDAGSSEDAARVSGLDEPGGARIDGSAACGSGEVEVHSAASNRAIRTALLPDFQDSARRCAWR